MSDRRAKPSPVSRRQDAADASVRTTPGAEETAVRKPRPPLIRRWHARLVRWGPAAVLMAVIFAFSHRTGSELNSFLPWFQRLVPAMTGFDWGHFVAYFALALAYAWAFGQAAAGWRPKIAIVGLCLLYGLTDEYHQRFVPGRTWDLHDLRNDGIGAALAMLTISAPPFRRWFAAAVARSLPPRP